MKDLAMNGCNASRMAILTSNTGITVKERRRKPVIEWQKRKGLLHRSATFGGIFVDYGSPLSPSPPLPISTRKKSLRLPGRASRSPAKPSVGSSKVML